MSFYTVQVSLPVICLVPYVDIAIVNISGAIIHDVDHPGRNSAYLCNSGSELAILYNDTTVLENHHCALGFKLTQSDARVNILAGLEPEVYKTVRAGLIDVVLATDMSKHFLHVNKFVSQIQTVQDTTSSSTTGRILYVILSSLCLHNFLIIPNNRPPLIF